MFSSCWSTYARSMDVTVFWSHIFVGQVVQDITFGRRFKFETTTPTFSHLHIHHMHSVVPLIFNVLMTLYYFIVAFSTSFLYQVLSMLSMLPSFLKAN